MIPHDCRLSLVRETDGFYAADRVPLLLERLHGPVDTCLDRADDLERVMLVPPARLVVSWPDVLQKASRGRRLTRTEDRTG